MNIVKSGFDECLRNGEYKVVIFVNQSNIDLLLDKINDLDKKYQASFDKSESDGIITYTSGNQATLTIAPMTDNVNVGYNTAIIDDSLIDKEDVIKANAEIFNDGITEYPSKITYISL